MYGMINEAIRVMVIDTFNLEFWEEVCLSVGHEQKVFENTKQYDDELTLKLVTSISSKGNIPQNDLLIAFGKFWIKYAKNSEYSSILDSFSDSPRDLIESIDNLHLKLEMIFDKLKAPKFWISNKKEGEYIIHYLSERKMGLEYFVMGLIEGIFDLYGQKSNINFVEPQNGETAVYKVTIK